MLCLCFRFLKDQVAHETISVRVLSMLQMILTIERALPGTRDLTQVRTGGQRLALEIRNSRNATIHSCYLLLSRPI